MPIAMAILFGVMFEDSCDCSIVSSIGVNVAGGGKPWVKSGKGGKIRRSIYPGCGTQLRKPYVNQL